MEPGAQLETPARLKGLSRGTAVTVGPPLRGRASVGKSRRRESKSPEQGSNARRSEGEDDDGGAGGPEKTLRGARLSDDRRFISHWAISGEQLSWSYRDVGREGAPHCASSRGFV